MLPLCSLCDFVFGFARPANQAARSAAVKQCSLLTVTALTLSLSRSLSLSVINSIQSTISQLIQLEVLFICI